MAMDVFNFWVFERIEIKFNQYFYEWNFQFFKKTFYILRFFHNQYKIKTTKILLEVIKMHINITKEMDFRFPPIVLIKSNNTFDKG